MPRNLPLSIVSLAVLAGCATELKPITKPANPRVVERELAPRKPASPAVDPRSVREPSARKMVPLTEDVSGAAAVPAAASDRSADRATSAAGVKGSQVATPERSNPAAGAAPEAQKAVTDSTKPAPAPRELRWQIKPTDVRLAATFERWARESAERGMPYTVLWNADRHVLIEAPTGFDGSLVDAIELALKSPSILHSDYPLEACEYPNSPPVVRITRQGEQSNECPIYR